MTPSRTALFVIDIQNDLAINPKTRIPHADRLKGAADKVISTARAVIDAERKDGAKGTSGIIVFVQHDEPPESGNLVKGTEPWELVFSPREGVDEELLVLKTTRKFSPASGSALRAVCAMLT
jgi:nicotinamidase-related amidase